MHILHITPSYKPAYQYGGTISAVAQLCENQVLIGTKVTIYTTTANGAEELPYAGECHTVEGVEVYYFARITKDHSHLSPALWRAMRKNLPQFDAVHIHSWWNFPVWEAVWACRLAGIRPVLSPHGMLSPFTLKNKSKSIFHYLIGKNWLKKTLLHATTPQEAEEMKKIIPNTEISVIHNIVEFSLPLSKPSDQSNQTFNLLFLSRIHPKKGLELLFQALANCPFPWQLTIAGKGDAAYLQSLRQMAQALAINQHISWHGWADTDAKRALFSQADLMVLTSHNENFAVVVLESLAMGVPVLLSEWVGLSQYVQENQLGWVCSLEIPQIIDALNKAYKSSDERLRIQSQAPNIIHKDFNASKVANTYLELYQNLKPTPDSKLETTNE